MTITKRPLIQEYLIEEIFLYWNPDIQLFPDKKMMISFYTSDSKGDYILYIRGKNGNDDSEVYGKCYFSVK